MDLLAETKTARVSIVLQMSMFGILNPSLPVKALKE